MPTASSTDASVEEGEKIGVVSNYLDHPNGTTRHLHFDVQVFTRDGWLWVNPYVTLISAYERLIRGRGREIGPEPSAPPAVAHALPEDVIRPGPAGRQRELTALLHGSCGVMTPCRADLRTRALDCADERV